MVHKDIAPTKKLYAMGYTTKMLYFCVIFTSSGWNVSSFATSQNYPWSFYGRSNAYIHDYAGNEPKP